MPRFIFVQIDVCGVHMSGDIQTFLKYTNIHKNA